MSRWERFKKEHGLYTDFGAVVFIVSMSLAITFITGLCVMIGAATMNAVWVRLFV